MQTLIASDSITLGGGPTVSYEALQLLWAFENRGCIIRRDDDGSLLIGPHSCHHGCRAPAGSRGDGPQLAHRYHADPDGEDSSA
jgi:hypothetical protein